MFVRGDDLASCVNVHFVDKDVLHVLRRDVNLDKTSAVDCLL